MMIFGLDTNVVLRMLIDDDPRHRKLALDFGAGLGRDYTAFLTVYSLLELDWALRSQYGYDRKQVVAALKKLLRTRGLTVDEQPVVQRALTLVETENADLADALIAAKSKDHGCVSTKTFDAKAARKVPEMELLA
ncbi:MAG: VapC toxin family PIN domain ribonuclease [Rhizobiales bacterium]|nr:VapC toxin family PIN domain ribonuclease [Hyphomicrobiales bacterium]MBA69424.1 VapC toxin family PIN domain ribonuclease [Hyphomicrobiales bacterium]|tara:strand:+ start:3043 stop:3447 length:405 start_codon:yes stop_codon:yes gene_type:complete